MTSGDAKGLGILLSVCACAVGLCGNTLIKMQIYMKIIGEITEGGFWVCVFGAKVLGRLVER